jgi:predicted amidophosphoribosyltransferase
LREAIVYFKYESEWARCHHLAALCTAWMPTFPAGAILAPVPLHPSRARSRGYNQSEVLANQIALAHGHRADAALLRTIATRPQVGLPAEERAANVRGAFSAKPGTIPIGSAYVLVDDVLTTGATLGECAKSLLAAGAMWVGALTVARSGTR